MGVVEGVIVGGLLSFASAAISMSAKKKQEDRIQDAMEKQRDVELAQQGESAAKERRKQIREARIQRARVENIAAAEGQSMSSAAIYGGQQVTGQAAQNIGAINTAQSFATATTAAREGVMEAQMNTGSLFSQVAAPVMGQIGGNILGSSVGKMFSSGTQSPTKT